MPPRAIRNTIFMEVLYAATCNHKRGHRRHCCSGYRPQRELYAAFARAEVIATAASAWGYTAQGRNWFGQRGSYLPAAKVEDMVSDPYFLALITGAGGKRADSDILGRGRAGRSPVGPSASWLASEEGSRRTGWIVPLSAPSPGRAISYRWGITQPRG